MIWLVKKFNIFYLTSLCDLIGWKHTQMHRKCNPYVSPIHLQTCGPPGDETINHIIIIIINKLKYWKYKWLLLWIHILKMFSPYLHSALYTYGDKLSHCLVVKNMFRTIASNFNSHYCHLPRGYIRNLCSFILLNVCFLIQLCKVKFCACLLSQKSFICNSFTYTVYLTNGVWCYSKSEPCIKE